MFRRKRFQSYLLKNGYDAFVISDILSRLEGTVFGEMANILWRGEKHYKGIYRIPFREIQMFWLLYDLLLEPNDKDAFRLYYHFLKGY